MCKSCGPRGGSRIASAPAKSLQQAYDPFGPQNGQPEPRRHREHDSGDEKQVARDRKRARSRSRQRGGDWDVPGAQDASEVKEQKEKPKTNDLDRVRPDGKRIADLIGVVRPVRNPSNRRICEHFLKNDCLWGDQCRFSHDPEELRAGTPATTEMDFSSTDAGRTERTLSIPRTQLKFIMNEGSRQLLTDATGISEITWDPTFAKVTIYGTPAQVDSGEQHLKRVITHCNWGASEAKVHGLLSLRPCKTARLRLSPMVPSLKPLTINLSAGNPTCSMGSDASNDVALKGPLISRSHATLEFSPEKGCMYVIDRSTNGTFLNGVRLPSKASGKVVLWHGDELLFPEPNKAVNVLEFGYMVNLELS